MDLTGLPNAPMIEAGLRDLRAGRESVEALLVMIGAPRLRRMGLDVPPKTVDHPEHRLYELVASSDPDAAHSRYNALIRALTSFERAAECVSH
jgi:hypothetical protein